MKLRLRGRFLRQAEMTEEKDPDADNRKERYEGHALSVQEPGGPCNQFAGGGAQRQPEQIALPAAGPAATDPVRELSERLHVLLSAEQAEQLRALSESSGRPVGQLVREALDRTYSGSEPVASRAAIRRVAETVYIKEDTWESVRAGLSDNG